ncbi:unnamed protein product [Paramecium sonneborni]|uniref:Uncharacterized protein n=1 Tax=Paramecium sonneborni TaxID=65129 RepID=A0A8S1RQ92_9CILI|nr:unnamed protein product [Paramecium sonneborni]
MLLPFISQLFLDVILRLLGILYHFLEYQINLQFQSFRLPLQKMYKKELNSPSYQEHQDRNHLQVQSLDLTKGKFPNDNQLIPSEKQKKEMVICSSVNKAYYSFNINPDLDKLTTLTRQKIRQFSKFKSNIQIQRKCFCNLIDTSRVNQYTFNKANGKFIYDVVVLKIQALLMDTQINQIQKLVLFKMIFVIIKLAYNMIQLDILILKTMINFPILLKYVHMMCIQSQKMKFVKATTKEQFINSFLQFGIDQYTCQKKNCVVFCQYYSVNKQCLSVTRNKLSSMTIYDLTFNWAAYIQISFKCQFQDNQCQSFSVVTLWEDLQNSLGYTNSLLQYSMHMEYKNQNQQLVSRSIKICSQPDLNKIGDSYCTYNYENVDIQRQIISIRTKVKYCKFDSFLGFIDITSAQTA